MRISKADVEATGKPRLMGLDQVAEGHKTETQWNKEGMQLKDEAEPAAYVYVRGRGIYYAPYTSDAIEPKRKQRAGQVLPLNSKSIGSALYEINKAAKRRRDAARKAYGNRDHNRATSSRAEKDDFYKLKNVVMARAIAVGMAKFVGHHVKQYDHTSRQWIEDQDGDAEEAIRDHGDDEYGDCDDDFPCDAPSGQWGAVKERRITNMELFEIGGFRFHRIVDQFPTRATTTIEDLGAWESAATARPKHMALKDAEATLHAFLQSSGEGLMSKQ